MLETIQRSERYKQNSRGKQQRPQSAQRLFPIGGSKESQAGWHQRQNRYLKDVGGGSFIGLRRQCVTVEDNCQRHYRQDNQSSCRKMVNFLRVHYSSSRMRPAQEGIDVAV